MLTEEVADTALGLLLMTVRELSAAERHLRAGKWPAGNYPLTGTMRDRTVGIVGLGRIGMAIARRLDAMQVPVVYHTRRPRPDVAYRHYADLAAMATDVDTLIVVVPGTAETRNMIDADILKALGPNGVLINIGRGIVVDEPALIAALKDGTIRAAGLDVFADEPNVPAELIALPNAVLLPHVGSASVHTRDAMGQLVVDNLRSWFEKGKPLTPVPETPWPRREKVAAHILTCRSGGRDCVGRSGARTCRSQTAIHCRGGDTRTPRAARSPATAPADRTSAQSYPSPVLVHPRPAEFVLDVDADDLLEVLLGAEAERQRALGRSCAASLRRSA